MQLSREVIEWPWRLPAPTSRALQLGHVQPSVFLLAVVGVHLESMHFGVGS